MHAGIGSARALQTVGLPGNGIQCMFQYALHRLGVLLYLEAMITASIVFNKQG